MSYRRRLGIVPQDAHLFSGQLAANIRYGRPEAARDEVEAAARAVGMWAAVEALPGGLEHSVGERGAGLSGGEQQLVAIARAHLVEPDMLLFDEATATLDPVAERAVLEASEQLAAGRTSIVVAHRLRTAQRADRVLVMREGSVVEQGTHAELLAGGGEYAALWNAATAQHGRGR